MKVRSEQVVQLKKSMAVTCGIVISWAILIGKRCRPFLLLTYCDPVDLPTSFQGDYAGAEPLLERCLTIMEATLGPENPSLATTLNNKAGLLRAQVEPSQRFIKSPCCSPCMLQLSAHGRRC